MGAKRLFALGGVGFAFLIGVALVAGFASRPQMAAVYSGLEPAEAGRIVAQIESMGIAVGTGYEGSVVTVPADDVARVRMALAEKGLPAAGGVGYELFDGENGLGLTSFMQRMNRSEEHTSELQSLMRISYAVF